MNTQLFHAAINCGQAIYFSGYYYIRNSKNKEWYRWYEKDHISYIDWVPFLGY